MRLKLPCGHWPASGYSYAKHLKMNIRYEEDCRIYCESNRRRRHYKCGLYTLKEIMEYND